MPQAITPASVEAQFHNAADLSRKQLGPLTLYYIDGLTSSEEIAAWVLRPLDRLSELTETNLWDLALSGGLWAASVEVLPGPKEAVEKLLGGWCVLVWPEGRALSCEVKGGEKRSVSQPQVQPTVKGPKDAFTETLRTNTALLRRHLRRADLGLEELSVGTAGPTQAAVVWLRGRADPELPEQVKARLLAAQGPGPLTPAELERLLIGAPATAFPLLLYTERPDQFCQGLLEGRMGVLAQGLPLGYLAPVSFSRFLAAPEDKSQGWVLATVMRGLRYLALGAGLLLPGLYIAMACFHPEMIPLPLLRAIMESKAQVPFSTPAEVLTLLAAFELLQEAGLHLPQSVGQSVSIIGGLVVGTAAVEAKLISPAALIVVAAAGICGYTLPDQDFSGAVRLWRAGLAVCAALAGLFGLTAGVLGLLIHLAGLSCLDRPYLAPFGEGKSNHRILPGRAWTDPGRAPTGPERKPKEDPV